MSKALSGSCPHLICDEFDGDADRRPGERRRRAASPAAEARRDRRRKVVFHLMEFHRLTIPFDQLGLWRYVCAEQEEKRNE